MERWLRLSALVFGLICLSELSATPQSRAGTYTENVATLQYCDTLTTTARWDTLGGQLGLFPFEISLAGSCNTPGEALYIAASGDFAYVADGDMGGLQVIDISDPANPAPAGAYYTPGRPEHVALAGDCAYVADYFTGLLVIQVYQHEFDSVRNTAHSVMRRANIALDGRDGTIRGASRVPASISSVWTPVTSHM